MLPNNLAVCEYKSVIIYFDFNLAKKMKKAILTAINILKGGGLVAIPTETVYGLAADAKNDKAIEKVFFTKKRPINHPLIVHVGDSNQLAIWASSIPDSAFLLIKEFWPGPLTLLLKKNPSISKLITAEENTIALRMPNHPLTLKLLKEFNGALVAPSANRFGKLSPTSKEAVIEELGEDLYILDGGICNVGIESTILDLTDATMPCILRPGIISAETIEKVLGIPIYHDKKNKPHVSGSHSSHYAPNTPLYLFGEEEIEKLKNENDIAIVSHLHSHSFLPHDMYYLPTNPLLYARALYATLRLLDKKNYKALWIEKVPEDKEWDGIRDRLKRAITI